MQLLSSLVFHRPPSLASFLSFVSLALLTASCFCSADCVVGSVVAPGAPIPVNSFVHVLAGFFGISVSDAVQTTFLFKLFYIWLSTTLARFKHAPSSLCIPLFFSLHIMAPLGTTWLGNWLKVLQHPSSCYSMNFTVRRLVCRCWAWISRDDN
jgi:hypothetical protein